MTRTRYPLSIAPRKHHQNNVLFKSILTNTIRRVCMVAGRNDFFVILAEFVVFNNENNETRYNIFINNDPSPHTHTKKRNKNSFSKRFDGRLCNCPPPLNSTIYILFYCLITHWLQTLRERKYINDKIKKSFYNFCCWGSIFNYNILLNWTHPL